MHKRRLAPTVAIRFGVDVNSITLPKLLPQHGLLDPGVTIIPDTIDRSLSPPAIN
jgi:hypothetical protein